MIVAAQPIFKPLALVLRNLGARHQRYSLGPFISVQQGMREGGSTSATSATLLTGTILSKHGQRLAILSIRSYLAVACGARLIFALLV